jgi:hypothetical protein
MSAAQAGDFDLASDLLHEFWDDQEHEPGEHTAEDYEALFAETRRIQSAQRRPAPRREQPDAELLENWRRETLRQVKAIQVERTEQAVNRGLQRLADSLAREARDG